MSHSVIIIDPLTGEEIGRYSPPHEEGGGNLAATDPAPEQTAMLDLNWEYIRKQIKKHDKDKK